MANKAFKLIVDDFDALVSQLANCGMDWEFSDAEKIADELVNLIHGDSIPAHSIPSRIADFSTDGLLPRLVRKGVLAETTTRF